MFHTRHAAALAIGLVALGLTACGSSTDADDDADTTSAGASAEATADDAPGVYGAPIDATRPDPTGVATDAPVPAPPAVTGEVRVRLTYSDYDEAADAVELTGYVPGVSDAAGTCTLTLTQAGRTATASVPGTVNGEDTDCGGALVPRAQLAPGIWTAVLAFHSPTTSGTSVPTEVTVP
jgi:hypothetical protein